MKALRTLVLPCAIAVLASCAATTHRGNDEQDISALSDAMIQANLKEDIAYYEKHYADDAIIVHGNGKLFSKTEELADLRSGALKYEAIEVKDKRIRLHGDTAVVNILLTFKGSLAGKPFPPTDLRRTVVWVRKGAEWKVVAWQVTRAP